MPVVWFVAGMMTGVCVVGVRVLVILERAVQEFLETGTDEARERLERMVE